jgi:hypothetical protein
MQMTMDRLQLDCAKFVAMYRNKGDAYAQSTVNGTIAQYIVIYENLANSLSPVMCPGPCELPQLQEWLSSQLILTERHKLRNLCAHNANVKAPLKGSTYGWSVFKPDEFFESVKTQMPFLIGELHELTADLEKNMNRYRTPLSTPPDNLYTINESYARQLLADKNEDFLLNDFHQRMTKASDASEAMCLLVQRVNSREMNLPQKYAYECSTKFKVLKEQFYSEACTIQQERNERAAEIVATPSEKRLSASQNPVFGREVGGQDPSNLDWGVDPSAAAWAPDEWVLDTTDGNTHPGLLHVLEQWCPDYIKAWFSVAFGQWN